MLTWSVHYLDKSGRPTAEVFSQFSDDNQENSYVDIDRGKPLRFDLVNAGGKAVYSVYIRGKQSLVFRRRNFVPLGGQTPSITYVVGWTMLPKTGERIFALNYLMEDGTVSLDDHRNNIKLLPFEE